jgi:hypothetical protein
MEKGMIDEIQKVQKRAVQYFYNDGLTEIAVGAVFLILGLYFFGQAALPKASPLKFWLDSSFLIIFLAAFFLAGRIIRFLKRRLTYPRTGYVSYKRKKDAPRRRRLAAATGAIIAGLLASLIAVSPNVRAWLPAVNGFLLGAAVFLFANRVGLLRFYVLAALSSLTGFVIAAAGFGDIKGVSLYYAVFGASVTVSGVAALIVYLRRSRLPEEDGHGA